MWTIEFIGYNGYANIKCSKKRGRKRSGDAIGLRPERVDWSNCPGKGTEEQDEK